MTTRRPGTWHKAWSGNGASCVDPVVASAVDDRIIVIVPYGLFQTFEKSCVGYDITFLKGIIVHGVKGAAYHLICRLGAIIQGTPEGLISLDISSFTRGL